MAKVTFVPGDLVLVNLPVPKVPSQRRAGYWPAKITRKLQNCSRQVKCYATREVVKVSIQSMVVYSKETIEAYLGTQADKDSVLAQALAEIEADFVAQSLTAEEIHLSREPERVTSVVKSPRLLETIDVGSTLLNLWNSYVEKSIGNSWGMCHLKRFIEDFVKEHKEVILSEEIYRNLILHVCSLEEVGLISSIEVKSIVYSLTELIGIKDGSSNVALECPSDATTDSTAALVTECPNIIDVDIDSPIEITASELKFAFPGEVLEHFSDKSTSDLQPVLCDFPDKRVDTVPDISVLNITSVLKNAAPGQLSDKFWLKSRKHSPRSRNLNLPWLNSRKNSRPRSKNRNFPRNRSRSRSSDRNLPRISSRRSRTTSRDRNLSGAGQQSTDRCEIPPGVVEEQQTVMPYKPRVFPLSEEEYNMMMAQETIITRDCNMITAQVTSMTRDSNKMMAQETSMTQDCHKITAQETFMTLDCNKIMTQETSMTQDCNKMMAQETLMTQNCKNVMAQETSMAQDCNKMTAQETSMSQDCNKIMTQETSMTQDSNKMTAQETSMSRDCNKMMAQETPKSRDCKKVMAQETSMTPECNTMVALENHMTPECNKMMAQENPENMVTLETHGCNKIISQDTLVTPEGNKVVAQETPLTTECNNQVSRKTPKAPEYYKMMAQNIPTGPKYKLFSKECNKEVDHKNPKAHRYNKMVAQKTPKAPKYKMVVQETPKAARNNGIVDQETSLVSLQSLDVDTTLSDSSDKSTESTISDTKDDTVAIVIDSSFEAQTSLQGGAIPAVSDYLPHIFNSTSNETDYTSLEGIYRPFEDGNHTGVVSEDASEEAQGSLHVDANATLPIESPSCNVNASSNVIKDTSTESTSSIFGEDHHAVVSVSPSEAESTFLGDATPILVIDYPTYIVDATSNVTNDTSEHTNNIPKDGHSTVVCTSESQPNFLTVEVDYPSSSSRIVYDATSKVVIDNPTDTMTLYKCNTQATGMYNQPTQGISLPNHPTQTTSLYNGATSHPNYSMQPTSLSNYPTQPTRLRNYPTQSTSLPADPAHLTSLPNYPTQATCLPNYPNQATILPNYPTHATILPNYPTQHTSLRNYLTQPTSLPNYLTQATSLRNYPSQATTLHHYSTQATSLHHYPTQATSLPNRPTRTTKFLNPSTGLLGEPIKQVLDNPDNTNFFAPNEPLTGEPCGDLLEQWWFGPRFGLYSRGMNRKINKASFGVVEKGGNNNGNKARGEIASSEITRNLDKNFNKDILAANDKTEAIKDDNEIEITGALGSDTFVEKVLFCNSKGKQVTTGTKRKRPPEAVEVNKKCPPKTVEVHKKNQPKTLEEHKKYPPKTVEVHKKYLMYGENGGHVLNDKTDEASVLRRSAISDSSIKQSVQGCCNSSNIRTDQSNKAFSSTNQDTNGNKCPVKISMNIEMSRDSFTRVSEEIPNFRAMATQKP